MTDQERLDAPGYLTERIDIAKWLRSLAKSSNDLSQQALLATLASNIEDGRYRDSTLVQTKQQTDLAQATNVLRAQGLNVPRGIDNMSVLVSWLNAKAGTSASPTLKAVALRLANKYHISELTHEPA